MDKPAFQGPLHLQRNVSPCTDSFNDVLRAAITHPLTHVLGLHCECMPSGILPAIVDPGEGKTGGAHTEIIRKRLESSRRLAVEAAANTPADRRQQCRFFSIKLNDEQGIVHSFCRRCNKRIIVYDRDLYWGIRRATTASPETFPYKCTCGSHMFEVAIGLEYPDEAMDENDINMISIGVRCASCNEVAVIFDDEAT